MFWYHLLKLQSITMNYGIWSISPVTPILFPLLRALKAIIHLFCIKEQAEMLRKILRVGNAWSLVKWAHVRKESWGKKESLNQRRQLYPHSRRSLLSKSWLRDIKALNQGLKHPDWFATSHGLSPIHLAQYFVFNLQLLLSGCKLDCRHLGHCKTEHYNLPENLTDVLICGL